MARVFRRRLRRRRPRHRARRRERTGDEIRAGTRRAPAHDGRRAGLRGRPTARAAPRGRARGGFSRGRRGGAAAGGAASQPRRARAGHRESGGDAHRNPRRPNGRQGRAARPFRQRARSARGAGGARGDAVGGGAARGREARGEGTRGARAKGAGETADGAARREGIRRSARDRGARALPRGRGGLCPCGRGGDTQHPRCTETGDRREAWGGDGLALPQRPEGRDAGGVSQTLRAGPRRGGAPSASGGCCGGCARGQRRRRCRRRRRARPRAGAGPLRGAAATRHAGPAGGDGVQPSGGSRGSRNVGLDRGGRHVRAAQEPAARERGGPRRRLDGPGGGHGRARRGGDGAGRDSRGRFRGSHRGVSGRGRKDGAGARAATHVDRDGEDGGRPVEALRAGGALPPGNAVPVRASASFGPRAQLAAPHSSDRRRATRGAGGVDDGRGGRVHPRGVAARTRARDPRRARDDGRGGCGEGGGFSG